MSDEEGIQVAVVQPPGEITPVAEQPPKWREEQLGLCDEHGVPLAPDVREVRYGLRDIVGWDFAVRMGKLAGLEDASLYNLAVQYHTAHPEHWREMLLDALEARQISKPPDQFDRARNLTAWEQSLWDRLSALANSVRPEVRCKALQAIVDRLQTGIARNEWRA